MTIAASADVPTQGQVMTDAEKAWLACAIDGEGFISLVDRIDPKTKWRQRYVEIGVVNTDRRFVDYAAKLFGAGTIRCKKRGTGTIGSTSYAGKKDVFDLRLKDHDKVSAVLQQIRPYLIIKQDKADRVLEFVATTKWREMTPSNRERRAVSVRESWANGKRSRVRSEEAKAKQRTSMKAYWEANPMSDAERERRSERFRRQ